MDTQQIDLTKIPDAVPGLLQVGTVDLSNRSRVRNPDGSISTVRSMSFGEDGKEILVPTVSDDGRVLSNDDAVALYHKTKKHLGMFDTPEHATAYAQKLHEDQAKTLGQVDLTSIPDAPSDGAVTRFAKGVWKPIGGMLDLADQLGKEGAAKLHDHGLAAIPDVVSGVVKGVAQGMVQPVASIGPLLVGGKPAEAGETAVDQVVPVSDLIKQTKAGNYAGAAGEALSTAAMLLGPHALKERAGVAPEAVMPEVAPHPLDLSAIPDAAPSEVPTAVHPIDLSAIPDVSDMEQAVEGRPLATPPTPTPPPHAAVFDKAMSAGRYAPEPVPVATSEAVEPSTAAEIVARANDEARHTDRTTGQFDEGPGGLSDVSAGRIGRAPLPDAMPASALTPEPVGAGVTLHSEILPGAAAFAEHDLAPLARGLKSVAVDLKNLVSPQTASPEAQSAANTVAAAKAATANSAAVEMIKYKDDVKTFAKQTDNQNLASIAQYERTGAFPNMPSGYSDRYRESMSIARTLLQHAYGQDSVGYIENYVRRAFEFGSKEDEAKGLASLGRTLSANRSPLRGRVLDMPLDEALSDMKARGIDVKMATTNPEALRQWTLENAHQAANMSNALRDLKGSGDVAFVVADGKARPPDGWVPLDEKGWRYFDPKEKGIGTYYADPNVARVLNNAVSKGLGGSPTFQGIRAINASLNELQLGVSLFHATGTAINSGLADLSTGLRQVARGIAAGDADTTVKGLAGVGRSVVPPVSAARFLNEGRKIVNGLKHDNPEAWKVLIEQINPSGARLQMESRHSSQMVESMQQAWSQGNVWGAGIRLPRAVIQTLATPLMQYAIPRIKLGVLMDRIADVDARMPDAGPAEKARAYRAASDQVDNVFGLMVYDNVFANKTALDLAQVATRSVGWTGGSLRWGLGAAADVRGAVVDRVTGAAVKRPLMTDRVMDAATLPLYVGTIGAVYMYAHTGRAPQTTMDYFYPQNGKQDASGAPSRTTLPTYMKDVEGYANAPVQTLVRKQSPILETGWSLATNRDYWNDLIRNPDDSKMTQAKQTGEWLLKEVLPPISLTQMAKVAREGTNPVEPVLGFTKASRAVTDTPLEAFLGEIARQHHDPLTPEAALQAGARRDVRQDVRKGDLEAARADAAAGKLGAKAFVRAGVSAQRNYLVSAYGHLTFDQAIKGYTVATPAQRALLRPLLGRKAATALDDASDATRGDIITAVQTARALPVAAAKQP